MVSPKLWLMRRRRRRQRVGQGWITDNIYLQSPSQSLAEILALKPAEPRPEPPQFVHAVGFYPSPKAAAEQLYVAETAVQAARSYGNGVKHYNIQTAQEEDATPPHFTKITANPRLIWQVTPCAQKFNLPLICDILAAASKQASDDDFLVFTNADIALMPHFYQAMAELIALGFDAVTVTRRTIPDFATVAGRSSLAQAEYGASHQGFDCFVFKSDLFRRFSLTRSCVGVDYVERVLIYNLAALARRFLILRNAHLTYHFGDDRAWRDAAFEQLSAFNRGEALACFNALCRDDDQRRRLVKFAIEHKEGHVIGDLTERHLAE